jgi:hypothetical protein
MKKLNDRFWAWLNKPESPWFLVLYAKMLTAAGIVIYVLIHGGMR